MIIVSLLLVDSFIYIGRQELAARIEIDQLALEEANRVAAAQVQFGCVFSDEIFVLF